MYFPLSATWKRLKNCVQKVEEIGRRRKSRRQAGSDVRTRPWPAEQDKNGRRWYRGRKCKFTKSVLVTKVFDSLVVVFPPKLLSCSVGILCLVMFYFMFLSSSVLFALYRIREHLGVSANNIILSTGPWTWLHYGGLGIIDIMYKQVFTIYRSQIFV